MEGCVREVRGPHHSSKRTDDCELALCAPGTSPCSMCVCVWRSRSLILRYLHCALVMMLLSGTISPDIAMCKNGLGVECNIYIRASFCFCGVVLLANGQKASAWFLGASYFVSTETVIQTISLYNMPARLIMVSCPAQHVLKSAVRLHCCGGLSSWCSASMKRASCGSGRRSSVPLN